MPLFVFRIVKKGVAELHLLATPSLPPLARHEPSVRSPRTDSLLAVAPMMIPLGRPGTPAEAAGGVFFLCSPWSNYVHGQVLNVNGGQFGGMTT